MLPRTPKHDFLAELHRAVSPWLYLEIGVQTGTSLSLADHQRTRCIGVDPAPMLAAPMPNTLIMSKTADQFFADLQPGDIVDRVDLGFIDGSHLVEDALRDFIGLEGLCDRESVIVFDDVLPYSPDIAGRTPLPGDWAGDVWKLWPIFTKWRPELKITVVDVSPTGLMVVQGLDPDHGPTILRDAYDTITAVWARDFDPTAVFMGGGMRPQDALNAIEENL